jgi:uracil-DNA glycosylase
MLWGRSAQAKRNLINEYNHAVLLACHPSPLSAHKGFLGCKHFSQANEYLRSHSIDTIDWEPA